MPGITGIISDKITSVEAADLAAMVRKMTHEAWHLPGSLTVESARACIGWSSMEGSFSDCNPVWNEDHTVCLVFSGEHFGAEDEARQLAGAGHRFKASDASRIVHMYEQEGVAFLRRLNGTFCGVLCDLRDGSVILFNDRFGLGRVYYHESGGRFLFGSEAKSILTLVPECRRLDSRGLGEYLIAGCALQDRTLFAGISILPPGSAWIFRRGAPVEKTVYFDRNEWDRQSGLEAEAYYARLKETFPRILTKYFDSPREVIMSLTGGLDSRLIMASHANKPGKVRCYGVRGIYRECEDVRVGRQVAETCGQSHQSVTVDEGFFKAFPDLAMRTVYYTDGTLDTVGSAGLYANRLARGLAQVRMTGNYGGEVLRGIVALRLGAIPGALFDPGVQPSIAEAKATYELERKVSRSVFIMFKQVSWHHYARFSMESSQLTVRSPYLDNELVQLSFQAPQDPAVCKALFLRLIADLNPALGALPTDRGSSRRPAVVPVAAWDWWKEFLPRAEYAWDYGMPHWLAKADRMVSPLRPEKLFLGIQKYCHFRTWYRHQLSGAVKEILLDPSALSRSYISRREMERRVTEHVTGRGNWTLDIHRLLTLEFVQRHLIEKA